MIHLSYDRIAPVYDILDKAYEVGWKRHLRRGLFEGLGGRVLDAGAGTGCNMPFYPSGADMVALDSSAAMLDRARRRAERLGIGVDIRVGDLLATGFPDGHFDHVVATFVFCVLPEELQLPVLREMARVCKPEGSIRILDYCKPKSGPARLWTRVVSPWLGFVFSARHDAGYESYVMPAGLDLVESRYVFGDIVKQLVARPATA